MSVVDDLVAEQDRLESILLRLSAEQWLSESGAAGWSVADVVLHLAQTEEGVVSSVSGAGLGKSGSVDDWAAQLVQAQRAAPSVVFARWQQARSAATAALRAADPQRPVPWVTGSLKPATLATTRLAEHWTHALDITVPFGIQLPDTDRLQHIAWLAHRTLPYALSVAGLPPFELYCLLTAPDGATIWRFGSPDAVAIISGPVGAFCRVAAQRLDPELSGLHTEGADGATALRLLRTYAA
jgi:uncharacterized protein (TIGR03084 family)